MHREVSRERNGAHSQFPGCAEEAVRLTVTSGKSVAQVARDLGVKVATLHEWRPLANYDSRLSIADNETIAQQLKRLQKESELLKQKCEVLKKAIAYFDQPLQE